MVKVRHDMSNVCVKNLSVVRNQNTVLDNIDLFISQGEFVAIVGKSGCGKTTFLQALAKLIPFSGDVVAPGNVGMIFQNHSVFPWQTVAENVSFGLDNLDKDDREKIAKRHIKLAQLGNKRNGYPDQLSGGQIQRVALARALAPNPELLLMDEPYGALDAYTRDKMQEWLLAVWAKYRRTIIFVTHNIEEAIFLADRVLVLNNKKISREFSIDFDRPRHEEIKYTPQFNLIRKKIYESIV